MDDPRIRQSGATPEQVEAVLRALAQFAQTQEVVRAVAGAERGRDGYWPGETALGRYFHSLADQVRYDDTEIVQ